jgi:hypothetical protein
VFKIPSQGTHSDAADPDKIDIMYLVDVHVEFRVLL